MTDKQPTLLLATSRIDPGANGRTANLILNFGYLEPTMQCGCKKYDWSEGKQRSNDRFYAGLRLVNRIRETQATGIYRSTWEPLYDPGDTIEMLTCFSMANTLLRFQDELKARKSDPQTFGGYVQDICKIVGITQLLIPMASGSPWHWGLKPVAEAVPIIDQQVEKLTRRLRRLAISEVTGESTIAADWNGFALSRLDDELEADGGDPASYTS